MRHKPGDPRLLTPWSAFDFRVDDEQRAVISDLSLEMPTFLALGKCRSSIANLQRDPSNATINADIATRVIRADRTHPKQQLPAGIARSQPFDDTLLHHALAALDQARIGRDDLLEVLHLAAVRRLQHEGDDAAIAGIIAVERRGSGEHVGCAIPRVRANSIFEAGSLPAAIPIKGEPASSDVMKYRAPLPAFCRWRSARSCHRRSPQPRISAQLLGIRVSKYWIRRLQRRASQARPCPSVVR